MTLCVDFSLYLSLYRYHYRMFGYNLAAAHLGLRHIVAHSFAVSDVYAEGEGWTLIDAVPAKDVCHNFPPNAYPHVIHYCQPHYLLGKVGTLDILIIMSSFSCLLILATLSQSGVFFFLLVD
jgi:hypothetical protein